MKEIKFRVWVKSANRMDFSNLEDLMFDDGHYYWDAKRDGFIIMQYTGLKDKNGKEIYEGDIVKALKQEQDGSNSYEIKDIIRQERGGFKVFGRSMQDCYTQQDCVSIKNFMWCQYRRMNVCDIYYEILKVEVIGNIYENPKLLEVKG